MTYKILSSSKWCNNWLQQELNSAAAVSNGRKSPDVTSLALLLTIIQRRRMTTNKRWTVTTTKVSDEGDFAMITGRLPPHVYRQEKCPVPRSSETCTHYRCDLKPDDEPELVVSLQLLHELTKIRFPMEWKVDGNSSANYCRYGRTTLSHRSTPPPPSPPAYFQND